MRLLVLLILTCCACGPPRPVPPVTLHAGPPQTHYQQNGSARTLLFEQVVTNPSDSTQAVYAFAYAADNVAQPPARAVYPPRALAAMPQDRRFAVGNPTHGVALTLPPGDTLLFRGALPVPTTWPDGRPIAATAFREFWLYLYSDTGRLILRQSWPL